MSEAGSLLDFLAMISAFNKKSSVVLGHCGVFRIYKSLKKILQIKGKSSFQSNDTPSYR